ncbi:tRNA-splicing endonuclease subunit [Varicellaria rhodocarpa]|nr:tRNA-splicing endonuclease subunit [Varicellaria rhodocarpa]
MALPAEITSPNLPFVISRISSKVERYFLYDINVITWLRKSHHILGVLIGTLPQIPQQNVFLGLPLELMPEEARLLSEKGLAYIIDDMQWHQQGLQCTSSSQKEAFRRSLAREGREAAKASERRKLSNAEQARRKQKLNDLPKQPVFEEAATDEANATNADDTELIFESQDLNRVSSLSDSMSLSNIQDHWAITPSTSYPPLPTPPLDLQTPSPNVRLLPYALFKHLHDLDYYMAPGLRFGCHFLVYPGDPLRYHSHFLAVGVDWDDEIDLLDIVGGGRLGTGVKKCWLLGGVEGREREINRLERDISVNSTNPGGPEEMGKQRGSQQDGIVDCAMRVRTFCIEWGGM